MSALRTLFYNDVDGIPRSGWRIAIFLLLFALVNVVSFPLFGWLRMQGDPSTTPYLIETIFYALLFLCTVAAVLGVDRRPVRAFGFVQNGQVGKELLAGLVVGGGLMTLVFVVEASCGWIALAAKPASFWSIVVGTVPPLGVFVVGAFGEELLFRGYLFQTLTEGTNKVIAVLVLGVGFGFAHAGNPNVTLFAMANVALAGVLLSVAYYKTRTLWFPIALHFAWNFFQSRVYSFPVSGIRFDDFRPAVLTQSGPVWLTGGSFGPEGGAIATAVLIAGTLFVGFTPWIGRAERTWTLEGWREGLKVAREATPIHPPAMAAPPPTGGPEA